MEIKNFGDLKKAICLNNELELELEFNDGEWADVRDYDYINLIDYKYRVKPEKEYVPFTADDWDMFYKMAITMAGNNVCHHTITSWNRRGVYIDSGMFIGYKLLRDNYTTACRPCGKEVIK